MATTPSTVPVAGLLVPAALVPRIMAAMRGLYPEVTNGIADNDAMVRAVLKHWVTVTLSQWESEQAKAPVVDALQQVTAEYETASEDARAKAVSDAALIMENPAVATS